MGTLKAVFLGLLQGLTEFLPVSSSGHLAIAQQTLPGAVKSSLAFDVLLHVGTLASVLFYFRNDLLRMAAAVLRPGDPEGWEDRRTVALLAVATLPIVVIGLAFASSVEAAFESVTLVGCNLIFTGFALWYASCHADGRRSPIEIGFAAALLIGCFQAVAILPGVSRSGLTLVGAMACGMERAAAARFAFLLAIPAIAGALVHSLGDLAALDRAVLVEAAIGTLVAGITGVLAIGVMMRVVRMGRLLPFAVYCWAAGSAAVLLGRL